MTKHETKVADRATRLKTVLPQAERISGAGQLCRKETGNGSEVASAPLTHGQL